MGRSGLIGPLAIWLAASAAGVALIVVLPEDWLGGGRLFSLNARHGPSASDAVGLALILIGWAFWLRALWRRRAVMPRLPAWVVLVAAAGCPVAVAAGEDHLAIVLGIAAFAGQVALGFMTGREGRSISRQ